MNKNKFIKIVSFFLSIPCLANSNVFAMQNQEYIQSNIFAMKQSQLHSQLDQISYDLGVAVGNFLDFLKTARRGYISRYLKDEEIDYVRGNGWLSECTLDNKDLLGNRYHHVEFKSRLDKDTAMILGISFYPKLGRVLVKKIVRSLKQIEEKYKNSEIKEKYENPEDFYNESYNDLDYKISKKTCFFNCYLESKTGENINLTQLFKNLYGAYYNYNNMNNNINANNLTFKDNSIIDSQFNNNSDTMNNNDGGINNDISNLVLKNNNTIDYYDQTNNQNNMNNIFRQNNNNLTFDDNNTIYNYNQTNDQNDMNNNKEGISNDIIGSNDSNNLNDESFRSDSAIYELSSNDNNNSNNEDVNDDKFKKSSEMKNN